MITSNRPQVALDGKYPIGQASAILGIDRKTLRKYNESGLIKCGYRRESARKFFLGSELIRFWEAKL